MPICVDCDHWSPGTFKSCPDCSGVLKLEPLWARPSRDEQLSRLDWEAKWWHRRARDETKQTTTRAEAWAMVEDLRQRCEELRRRLLPVLTLAEARRVERIEAEARVAGLTVRAYETKVTREGRERAQATDREIDARRATYRILFRRSGRFFVLLHAFEKRTREIPEGDAEMARDRWRDLQQRMDANPRSDPRAIGRDAP